ncbi:hypothetical protein TNCV_61051 [Trichonephila clavipes]|nr:hypothetical protein TNCV_61051 [Trichonephila clavipes]
METLELLSKVYGESTLVISKIYELHRRFQEDGESNQDDEQPSTSWKAKNVSLVSECVGHQTLALIAKRYTLLEGVVHSF